MTDNIHYKQNTSLPLSEVQRVIPLFRTKKEALDIGKKFGWNSAIKVHFRFETVWLVGEKMIQPDETCGVVRDHYRFPLLTWRKDQYNIKYCPTLDLYVVRDV